MPLRQGEIPVGMRNGVQGLTHAWISRVGDNPGRKGDAYPSRFRYDDECKVGFSSPMKD